MTRVLKIAMLFVLLAGFASQAQLAQAGDQSGLPISGFKPDGNGPFPALVLLHGCAGIRNTHEAWARLFSNWGYVSILPGRYEPRGLSEICGHLSLERIEKSVEDAHSAYLELMSVRFVDPKRIGLVGWSHGGTVVLEATRRDNRFRELLFKVRHYISIDFFGGWFSAAIAFYPDCGGRERHIFSGKLLLLIGELDDWTPAGPCRAFTNDPSVSLRILASAHHNFDDQGLADLGAVALKGIGNINRADGGATVAFSPPAYAEAQRLIKEFLRLHLGGQSATP